MGATKISIIALVIALIALILALWVSDVPTEGSVKHSIHYL